MDTGRLKIRAEILTQLRSLDFLPLTLAGSGFHPICYCNPALLMPSYVVAERIFHVHLPSCSSRSDQNEETCLVSFLFIVTFRFLFPMHDHCCAKLGSEHCREVFQSQTFHGFVLQCNI